MSGAVDESVEQWKTGKGWPTGSCTKLVVRLGVGTNQEFAILHLSWEW